MNKKACFTKKLSLHAVIAALLLSILAGNSIAHPNSDAVEKFLVSEALFRVFHYVDIYDWEALRGEFAEEIVVDYRNHGHDSIKRYTPDGLVAEWKRVHQGYDSSQHLLGNLRIELNGNEATVHSFLRARHRLDNHEGDNSWEIEGRYTHKLRKENGQWKLSYATLEPTFTRGNRGIFQMQQERFTEQQEHKKKK